MACCACCRFVPTRHNIATLVISCVLCLICVPLTMAGPGIYQSSGLYFFLPILLQLAMHLQMDHLWFIFSIPLVTQCIGSFLGFLGALTVEYNWLIFLITIPLGIVYILPYWLDVFVQRRFKAVYIRLLTLPAGMTAISALITYLSPFADWTDIGNSMNSFLEINRIAAFTGLGGITFFLGLCASTVNYILDCIREEGFPASEKLPGATFTRRPYCSALSLFLIGFVALLACNMTLMFSHPGLQETLRAVCLVDGDLATTESIAQSVGPDIVVWSEHSMTVNGTEGEDALLLEAGALAKKYQLVLGVTYTLLLPNLPNNKKSANVLTVVTPEGTVGFNYRKSHLIPGVEARHIPGPAVLPYFDTKWGARIGGSICFDFDFPTYIRQAGLAGVDVMLQPSYTWETLSVAHQVINVHRSIEQGFSCSTTTRCSSRSCPPGHRTAYAYMSEWFPAIFGFALTLIVLVLVGIAPWLQPLNPSTPRHRHPEQPLILSLGLGVDSDRQTVLPTKAHAWLLGSRAFGWLGPLLCPAALLVSAPRLTKVASYAPLVPHDGASSGSGSASTPPLSPLASPKIECMATPPMSPINALTPPGGVPALVV
ncbi:putative carbon-nitrogen hydrolase [Paratrimastix pyriformis]|uniref:Carbon-nitrogen hydrolase n=1 Tax=Paratrimastix pyriformis TaxID=342808 RepID=A0ABQ8US51_9EUKA|nr:putative carbon-nitrogen hydrolase [Paratrimastix pyriformis]